MTAIRNIQLPEERAAGAAEARFTRIDITTMESPTFGGYAWPGVGQYEKIADHDD
jgi:hypothetical protein